MVSFQKMEMLGSLCKTILILGLLLYFLFVYIISCQYYPICTASDLLLSFKKNPPQISISSQKTDQSSTTSPTNLSHLVFGLVGSEEAWRHRKQYIESWWRPNVTRGCLFLDKPPTPKLLPWSPSSPPYKISDDLTTLLNKTGWTAQRIIHGIVEAFRELDHENLRWLVMGDDDSIFFLDNIVDALKRYDHRKYYYIGGQSEFILSNYWYSFSQGFGGAGFILSYPLAKALAKDMENCLMRYKHLNAADQTTMSCVADLGVSLTPLKGIHQIDLRGDISGFLSSHPNSPLLSLHHFDAVSPIFPTMDRAESTRHLMKAAKAAPDQSRMLQQTICYHRNNNWSFSISWGYSVHIYERIMPRSYLQMPIETFQTWQRSHGPPNYMFNTRRPSDDPCEAPHVFYYENAERLRGDEVLTSFSRASGRGLGACSSSGNHSADAVSRVQVYSPATKRVKIDRSECCDIIRIKDGRADLKFRECMEDEIIA